MTCLRLWSGRSSEVIINIWYGGEKPYPAQHIFLWRYLFVQYSLQYYSVFRMVEFLNYTSSTFTDRVLTDDTAVTGLSTISFTVVIIENLSLLSWEWPLQ